MTRKLLSLINGLLIMFLSISSLQAFEIPFLSGNSEKVILNTNAMDISYNAWTGFSGSYDLFEIEGKNGFYATFQIIDNSFISEDTVIVYTAVFSNKRYMQAIDSINTNNMAEVMQDGLELLYKYNCDVYKNDKKINTAYITPYFKYESGIFNNELIFKNSFNEQYKFKLSEKYVDVINKKIQLYLRKKAEAIGKQ